MDSVLKKGTIPKSQVYQILRLLGADINNDSTININITDSLELLGDNFGDTPITLTKEEIDQLLPDVNFTTFNLTGNAVDG